jgi:vancomycin resistance protein YoaR
MWMMSEDQKTLDKTGARKRTRKVILILCGILVVAAIAVLASASHKASRSTAIFPNTFVNGIAVGGLSVPEAEMILSEKLLQDYAGKELPLMLPSGKILQVSAESAGAGPDVEEALSAAYARGRKLGTVGAGFVYLISHVHKANIPAEYALKNPDYVRSVISEAAAQIDQDMRQPVCRVTTSELIITKGVTGIKVDQEALFQEISHALSQADFSRIHVSPEIYRYSDPDLSEIWVNIFVSPQNAYYDKDKLEIRSHVTGVSFDLSAAQTMLQQAAEGTDVTIPFLYTEPEITTEILKAILFRDVLGSCKSNIGGTDNRVSNVALAASFVNEVILLPGEIFSYNGVVGSRTLQRGFLPAPAYVGGQTVDEVGGGICQVSSTVYLAALRANLRIVERYPHMYAVGYLPDGMDATVYYGSLDFRFQNDTGYPIMIEAVSEKRQLTIRIRGTKSDGTTVKIENKQISYVPYETVYKADESIPLGAEKVDVTGYSARKVEVYRVLYGEDGKLISRTLESVNNYKRRDEVVLVNPADPRLSKAAAAWLPEETEVLPEPSEPPYVDPSPFELPPDPDSMET